ncbi:hypothetical protein AVEN_14427-1 [Araneus ventricosus]|uniref:Zinc finger protein Rlf/292/654 TPR repeats domain-containing protein n=1 Tax=Araneus ventricosus TaxID=182803 RepID=A0A4Y2R083_ARAVE|nr:hypothetical protein AVEN_14427-1 [Araneus ventricosus]
MLQFASSCSSVESEIAKAESMSRRNYLHDEMCWRTVGIFQAGARHSALARELKTLLFMFSSKWAMYTDKGDLLCAFKYHYSAFKNITKNFSEIYKAVLEIFKRDPWRNPFFLWNDLFDGTVTIYDKRVQDYFESEPEEIVLARVHALVLRNRASDAMCLAKTSFLYHSRIAKSFRSSRRRNSTSGFSTRGHASIDWFLFILQTIKRSLDSIVNEVRQLECHEGVEILYRLWRDQKNKPFCYTLLNIFLLQDLIQSSKYCCTKRLFKIFCMMHEELHSSPKEIAESCHKLISKHAPSSAHFYLLVDVLWRQFGMKCLDLYVDLYVRGLTADINHLENKRHLGAFSDAESLETHIAAIFAKLSTVFKNLNPAVARECMFSAFSLRPTKERLFELQGLSQSLSNSNKNIHKSLLAFDFSTDCNCGLRCIGHCRDSLNRSSFVHPLLSGSIGNISHVVKRDFISVLEHVRCITFQYNIFDWRCNIGDLGNYLRSCSREATLEESDTESGEEMCESGTVSTKAVFETADDLECQFQRSSVKRKSGSDCSNEINSLNIGENIAVQSDDFTSKRMKTPKPNVEVSVTVSSNNQQVIQGFFNNSLENVIRMSLNNNPTKSWSDSMNLLKVEQEPVINDLNSSKMGRTGNSFQSCLSERNTPNNQRCIESKGNFSLHYSDKTHLQVSATLQYDHTQQRIAVAPENNTSFKEIGSSEHQNILKSHFVQKSSAKVSDFIATQPIGETFSNNIISSSHERRSSQEMTNLHFAAKSDRERHLHNHHLHSSPFVSSQPPPKSFSKHQFKIHPLAEAKTQIVTTLPSQEVRESVSCDNTRKSVIVNVKGNSLQLANQLPFPVKPSAIHQNGNNLQKDGSALQLLHVNVPNKYLTKPEIPVNANLIIPCKFDNSVSSSASQTSANDSKVESGVPELIVPGIMALPSMIKNNPWKTTAQNHAKPIFPAKISDGTPSSGFPKVSSKSGKMQSLQLNPDSDLVLKRNASNEREFGAPISKPKKDFKELAKNNLQHTGIHNKGMAYSNNQQLDNSLDSKLKWKMGQAHDSTRSQMTFHPISDSYNAPVSTSSQPWYASPHPKTNSNSPVSFSAHKMKTPKTSSSSPVSFPVHKMNTPQASSNSPVSSVHKMNVPETSSNSPVSFSVQHVKIPKTNSNSPVSFSVHNMNTPRTSSNSPVPSSVYKMNTPQTASNSPVSFSVQHMKIPKTNSNSPVSFSVQNVKTLESFGDKKVSTYTDANSHDYSSGNNVQNKPSLSFLKSRLTSMHNMQSYSHMNAYSYSKPNNFSAHDKAYSESHEPSQHQFDVKNIFERSTHSFISSANITSNSISSSQIQSNSSSVYNPVYPANDRRVLVHEPRNIATSSPSSNVQNIKSNAFSQQCCSPFEVNPCDTCSTKTSNQFLTKTQVIGFRSSPVENLHNQVS